MARGNTLTAEQNARIAEVLRRLMSESRERTQEWASKELGIGQGHVSRILKGSGGTSWPIAHKLARLARYRSAEQMLGIDETPPAPEPPERWIELEERYPNLTDAIAEVKALLVSRGETLSDEVLASARSSALNWPVDPEVSTWSAFLMDAHRHERRARRGPVAPPRLLPDEDDTPPAGLK